MYVQLNSLLIMVGAKHEWQELRRGKSHYSPHMSQIELELLKLACLSPSLIHWFVTP